MSRQQSFSGWYHGNTIFGVICTIACLASATRDQFNYNQSRRDSRDNVGNYLTRDLSGIDLVNLMQVLDFVLNSQEFQPLKIAIGTLATNPDLPGQISKFFERKLITCYQIDLRNNLSSFSIGNFHETTWIILAENPRNLDNNSSSWSQLIWNTRNKFLIIFLENDSPMKYEQIFFNRWQRDGISKMLITNAHERFRYFYRYLPFEGNFGKIQRILIDHGNVERKLNSAELNKKGNCTLKELKTIFEDFRNLNNHVINVTIFKSQMVEITKIGNETSLTGLDVNAMFLLQNVLNADFRITILPHDYKSDPFESGLTRIESGEADLIMTTYFVKLYDDYKSFDFTVAVHIDKVCLFGKAAGKVPKSFMPFLPISLDFWPVFIAYNILISAAWIKFKSFSDKIHRNSLSIRNKKIENSLVENCHLKKNGKTSNSRLRAWKADSTRRSLPPPEPTQAARTTCAKAQRRLFPGPQLAENLCSRVDPPEIDSGLKFCGEVVISTCSHLHGAETTPQRFFLTGTLLFTIIILGLYESTLLSAMRKPFEYAELHTLKDVLDTDFPILTKYQNLKDNTFYNRELKDRVVVVQNEQNSLRNIVVGNKSVLGIMRLSTADLEDRSKFYDANGDYMLHVIEECPGDYSLSYVVKRFSPYLERINKILSTAKEAGFFHKWYSDMRYPIYKEEQKKLASQPLITVLTLEHYSICFFILFGAFFCSTLVFIGEIQFARSASFRGYNKESENSEEENEP